MPSVNAFDDDSVRKIAAKVRQLEMRIVKAEMGNRIGSSIGKIFIFRTGDDEIPAMTEADGVYTPGSAEVTLYGFDAGDLESHEQLQEVFNLTTTPIAADTFGLCYQEHKTGKLVVLPLRSMYIAKNSSTAIAARTGTTVSYGSVTLYMIDDSDELISLELYVDAYNLSGTEVAADAWIMVKPEAGSGKWIVTWEDCA